MQALYILESYDAFEFKNSAEIKIKGNALLDEKINQASELFNINMLYLAKVAQYAETDARLRSSKYLPSQEDLNVNTKIAGNTYLWEILENNTLAEVAKDLEKKMEDDHVKTMYQSLVKSEAYQNYIAIEGREKQDEKAIMQHIWKTEMLGSEDFQEYLADRFDGWEDDKEMIMMLVDNFFKNTKKTNFLNFISSDKNEYAHLLLATVVEKDDFLMELIAPKLKNWDAERVANIDLILIKMGLSELIFFPTIPVNVTINEYIEIAKNYSTPQSGQFVNGVLDALMKELNKENKIRKVERTK